MTRVEQTGVAMRHLIDGDVCKRDGIHARQRVHGLISLCPMPRKHEGLPDKAAQRGCPNRKSSPGILVTETAKDWTAKNVSSALNPARYRRILAQ